MAISKTTCSVDGCNRSSREPGCARGMCGKHYKRFRKHGSPHISLIDREGSGLCSAPGCDRKSKAKRLCSMHLARLRDRGRLDIEHKETKRQWLQRHANYQGDDCLVWPFSHAPHGRGIVAFEGCNRSAPGAMARLAHGEPPGPDHQAAHTCGNGHKGCINPRHLRWATQAENEQDKRAHGTLRKGADINTCKLSEDDVREIRHRLGAGEKGVDIAAAFGIRPSQVSNIKLGISWAWLD